jgi:hypothetical protein
MFLSCQIFKIVSKLVFIFYGGIGIPDVEIKLYAAKASWRRQILDERSIIHKILHVNSLKSSKTYLSMIL